MRILRVCSLCEDVTEEVRKHGNVLRAKAVPNSDGHLCAPRMRCTLHGECSSRTNALISDDSWLRRYLAFASEQGAAKCVAALNGRWFAGKQVMARTIDDAEWPRDE